MVWASETLAVGREGQLTISREKSKLTLAYARVIVPLRASSLAAILRAPAREDGELLQDGTTEHLGAPSKHPKRQAGPAISAPESARPYPLLARDPNRAHAREA